jgi:glutamate-5-semialdehyde dehydrogenase
MKSIIDSAKAAKAAAASIALLDTNTKNRALRNMADALIENTGVIIEANAQDMAHGREKGTPEPMLDRLMLDSERIEGMADGLRQVAELPDPVGEVMDEWTTKEGLVIKKVRCPWA